MEKQQNMFKFRKTCAKCVNVKQNNFAKQCRSGNRNARRSQKPHDSRKELRPIRKSDDERISDSESTEYCYEVNNKQKHPRTSVSINRQRVKMTIDTGSSKLRNKQIELAIDETVAPVAQTQRITI